ncbi:MAG: hypothetical protein K2Q06_07265 [Parvularculaceae bacterium]|nr:hypothetical protein [Parvularculaceae bacterium]
MNDDDMEMRRRTVVQAAALAALAPAASLAAAAPRADKPFGKPGDFDFLTGEWTIRNKRPKKDGGVDEFDSEATVFAILGGICSVEELRIPARNFSGMGLRLLDIEKKLWSDFWVNAKSGALTTPGATGVFIDGVGEFAGDDAKEPVRAKGVWDMITPTSCRWRQLLSDDGGKTWREDWDMRWTRK